MSSEAVVSPDTVLQELGIDSLVAVDLRAWFVTELGIDMPILKILGGSTIIDLATDAVGRLSPTLLPGIPAEAPKVLVPNGLGGHDLVIFVPSPAEALSNTAGAAAAAGSISSEAQSADHSVSPATEVIEMPILTPPEEKGLYCHSKNLSISSEVTYVESVFSQVNSSASSFSSPILGYEGATDQWKNEPVTPTFSTSSDEADNIGTPQSGQTLERGEGYDGVKEGEVEVVVKVLEASS